MARILESDYQRYLEALLGGSRQRCWEVVDGLVRAEQTPETLYTELFQRSLYEVGDLWERARINVAVEHLATAVTESLLAEVFPKILAEREPTGKTAIISCSVNEHHQVGGRMVADIMEANGWDARFVGANTPVRDLLLLIQDRKPDLLGLSTAIYFNMAALWDQVDAVRSEFSDLDIVVGGQAFRWGGLSRVSQVSNLSYISSLEELSRELGQLDASS